MGPNSLTCIFANAMQQSSSIATATGTQIWSYHKKVKDFQEFLPYMYMDMVAILFYCAEPFEQIGNTLLTEGPCENWWKFLKQFQRRRHLNITQFYTCI